MVDSIGRDESRALGGARGQCATPAESRRMVQKVFVREGTVVLQLLRAGSQMVFEEDIVMEIRFEQPILLEYRERLLIAN